MVMHNFCYNVPNNHVMTSYHLKFLVIKGLKKTRHKNVVEKNTGKKKGGDSEQNDVQTIDERAEPHQIIESNVGPSSALLAPL